MKKNLIVLLCISVLLLTVCAALAREDRVKKNVRFTREWSEGEFPVIDSDFRGLQTSAQVDTYNIINFDFEANDWQGWTREDMTAQKDTFFHADDFSGLYGGDFGRLVAIEGTKSMWCGTRAGGR